MHGTSRSNTISVNDHGGDVWQQARLLGRKIDGILDFSANMNPFGPPPEVVRAIQKHLLDIRHYPEPSGGLFRNALSAKRGLAPSSVIVGNGAAELIWLLFRTLSPERVLVPAPSFSEYAKAARCAGAQVEYLPFLSTEPHSFIEGFVERLNRKPGCDVAVICNPNNPTGTLFPRTHLARLLAAAAGSNTLIMFDQSFLELSDEPEQDVIELLAGFPPEYDSPGWFAINSLTKTYAIPGLRLGWGYGPPWLITRMEASRDPWTVNQLAQIAGAKCIELEDFSSKSRKLLKTARAKLEAALKEISGISVFPSKANFLLLRFAGDSKLLAESLRVNGILIRNCGNFPGLDQSYFRVAVRTETENNILVKHLQYILNDPDLPRGS